MDSSKDAYFWDFVQTLVTGRTSEECEEYASMILANHPEVKARLDLEHGTSNEAVSRIYREGVYREAERRRDRKGHQDRSSILMMTMQRLV